MNYTVSHEGTVRITLHGGSDTTACNEAVADLEEQFADSSAISSWTITDATVFEGPTGPFDPYTIAVDFEVSVDIEAADATAAETAGETQIQTALDDAGLDVIADTMSTTVSPT